MSIRKLTRALLLSICVLTINSGKLMAQEAQADDPIVENRTDLSVQILRGMFGDVVNIIQGGEAPDSPDALLGKVMIVWCGSLFGIVLLLVGWNLFTWFFSATHSGKNKKSDLDQAGVSVRLIIALLSTVPLSAGYCFFQYGHILINGYSIQNANQLANIAYDNMSVGGQFNSQTNIQSSKITSQLFETFICQEGLNAVEGEELIKTHLTKNIDRTGETVVSVSQGNDSFFTTYSIDSCGKYEINADLPNFKFSIDGVPEEWFIESSFNAFLQTREQVGILAVNFVNSYLVDELEDSALEQLIASTQDQLASISNEYENRVRSIRNEYSEMKNNELNNSGQDIPPYLQPVPSFMDNYSVRELGWIALGATWWIDSVRKQEFNSMLTGMGIQSKASLDESILTHPDLAELWYASSKVTGGKSGRVAISENDDGTLLIQEKDRQVDFLINSSLKLVGESNDLLYSLSELGHEMIVTGEVLLATVLALSSTIEVLDNLGKSDAGGIPIISGFLATSKAIASGLAEGILKHAVLGTMLLVAFLFSMGLYLAFYLPMIPLMHWIGGVISAFSAVVEQFVLAPIHGLAHAFTEGRGFIGSRASQGYMLAFASFIRMPILVISFIVVYPFLLMMGKLTLTLWLPFAEGMTRNTVVGLVSFFGLVGALIALSVSVIERVFSIMNEINDRAIRLLGSPADSMGAQSFIHSGQTQFSSLQQTVSESGKGMATPTKSNENNLAP